MYRRIQGTEVCFELGRAPIIRRMGLPPKSRMAQQSLREACLAETGCASAELHSLLGAVWHSSLKNLLLWRENPIL